MKQLRTRSIIFMLWLVIYYLYFHYLIPDNSNSYIFFYSLVFSIFILLIPRSLKIPNLILVLLPAIIFISLKTISRAPLAGQNLQFIIIDVLSIIFTMVLLVWLRSSIQEFEAAVSDLTLVNQDRVIQAQSDGQGVLYREVRRARNHQRPLSLLAIAVDEKTNNATINQLIKDAQVQLIQQFMLGKVSQLLCQKLEDCDIILQNDNQFLIALPETAPEDLPALITRLKSQVADQLGIVIKIGTASLPQDTYTLEGLIEKATAEISTSPAQEQQIDASELFVKNQAGQNS